MIMEAVKPYSEESSTLRVVKALRDAMPKAVAAQLFGVSLTSAKRYATRVAERGTSLMPRKGGGRLPKTDETTKKLLEEVPVFHCGDYPSS
jgi:transposase